MDTTNDTDRVDVLDLLISLCRAYEAGDAAAGEYLLCDVETPDLVALIGAAVGMACDLGARLAGDRKAWRDLIQEWRPGDQISDGLER